MASTQSLRRYFSIELAIIVIATLLVALVTWRVFSLGIERIIVDQNAHLNLTRQVVDSLTPGLSQIGFWPPLLHLLMVPFVAIRSLYATGLAAVFTLLPFLALGAVFLYRLTLELTGYRLIAFWAALAYLLNPYMLYYTATPMMEVLFMGNLMGAAYFMLRWFRHPRLPNLLFLGMFITLATLSRFEGLILLPLALVIILIQLIRVRASRRRIEALVILFFLVASVGVFTILGYGYMFASDPLAFMNSQWSAFAQQRDYVLPTQGNVGAVITYLLHASYYLFTKPLVIAALVGGALTILLRPRLEIVAVLLVLLSPFLFVAAALYEGNAVLYLPELEPFTSFYNERYGLYWLGFAILAPALVLGIGLDRTRAHPALARPALLAAALVMGLSTAYLARHLYRTAFLDNYAVIQSSLRYPMENQREIAAVLGAEYDFGKIL
ncbi:MAG: glycosyltransferase family 39 protein, partial [Patescibacteria group bacterium]|nr:glycosyltransferase family 39 protein [Patescibacteria group bacterium]